MSFHGTIAAVFAALALAACASSAPPAEVSQGAVSVVMADAAADEPAPGTPEFHAARIGRDALRSRIQD